MKKRNRFAVLLLAVVLSVSAGACGSSDTGKDTGDTGQSATQTEDHDSGTQKINADLLASSRKKMNKISSMNGKMVLNVDMEISADGQTQTMQTVTTMDMTCFYDPLRLKMDMTMDAGDVGSTSSSIYAEMEKDGTYTQYIYNGTSWQSQTVDLDYLEQYNAADNMKNYMKDVYHFKQTGTEELNGVSAYKLSGAVTGDSIKEALLSSGALDSLASSGLDSSQIDSMTDAIDEIPIELWIDQETLYPLKYEMDMTSAMNSIMSEAIASAGEAAGGYSINITNMDISLTCSDYNEAAEFSIPEEAKGKTAV